MKNRGLTPDEKRDKEAKKLMRVSPNAWRKPQKPHSKAKK